MDDHPFRCTGWSLPTSLSKIVGDRGESHQRKRKAEQVRIFPTRRETEVEGTTLFGEKVDLVNHPIEPTSFVNWRVENLRNGRVIETTSPSTGISGQSMGVAKFDGTTGSGNFTGSSYSAWGTSMVRLAPYRQWSSFAPISAPDTETDMKHYVTVVTDSFHRADLFLRQENGPYSQVSFSHAIEGSDFIWETLEIDPGVTYTLSGTRGARFSGHISGSLEGHERSHPEYGVREEKGTGADAAYPAGYQERTAAAYAMPLPNHFPCRHERPDTFLIDTLENDCSGLTIQITVEDGEPVKIKFIRLSCA